MLMGKPDVAEQQSARGLLAKNREYEGQRAQVGSKDGLAARQGLRLGTTERMA